MKLTFVEKLPEKRCHSNLQAFIEDFCKSDSKIAKIEFTDKDYVSTHSCYGAWRVAAKRSRRPVKVIQRNNEIYLVKIV